MTMAADLRQGGRRAAAAMILLAAIGAASTALPASEGEADRTTVRGKGWWE